MHIHPPATVGDIAAFAGPIVTVGLAVASYALAARNRKLENARAEDTKRVDTILKERAELYDENRMLRGDLRTEIERLKDGVQEERKETAHWRAQAAEWEHKYERELLSNVALHATNEELRATNEELKTLVTGLRTDITSLQLQITSMQTAAANATEKA